MSGNSPYNVLFLCTGNSARSVISEALLNRLGTERFYGFSAGSQPKGKVHPKTIELLKKKDYDTRPYSSKSWNEFIDENAPQIDIVITVCSNAANESCPIFPGNPISTHWNIDDPARHFENEKEQEKEFQNVYLELERRIKALINIPIEELDKTAISKHLQKVADPK